MKTNSFMEINCEKRTWNGLTRILCNTPLTRIAQPLQLSCSHLLRSAQIGSCLGPSDEFVLLPFNGRRECKKAARQFWRNEYWGQEDFGVISFISLARNCLETVKRTTLSLEMCSKLFHDNKLFYIEWCYYTWSGEHFFLMDKKVNCKWTIYLVEWDLYLCPMTIFYFVTTHSLNLKEIISSINGNL